MQPRKSVDQFIEATSYHSDYVIIRQLLIIHESFLYRDKSYITITVSAIFVLEKVLFYKKKHSLRKFVINLECS